LHADHGLPLLLHLCPHHVVVNSSIHLFPADVQQLTQCFFWILGYGMSSDGTTIFINASTCNLMYRAINKPVVFDIEVNEKNVKK
jgi:hypothetical protein